MRRKTCSVCGGRGHNKRKHRKPRHGASKLWQSTNAGYAANRAAGLCDACGKRSRTSRCPSCARRRNAQPSRQAAYRKRHERGHDGGAR